MPSTYTESGLELIASGEQSGTWGDTTNTNWQIVDRLTGARLSKTLSAAGSSGSPTDITISDGTLSEGMYPSIDFVDGADLGATAYVRLTPNDAERLIWVRNSLSGSRSILLFQGTYSASNDLELLNGYDYLVHFDGAGSGAVVTQVNAAFPATTFNLTEAELSQLQNIDSSTISATQWGYLGGMDQALDTTASVEFDGLGVNRTPGTTGVVEIDAPSGTLPALWVKGNEGGGGAGIEIATHSAATETDLAFNGNAVVGTATSLTIAHEGAVAGTNFIRFGSGMTDRLTGTAGFSEYARFDGAGNFGIGVTAPTFAQGGGLEIHHATAANIRLERTSATASAMEIVAGDGLCEIDVRTAADLAISTSNTERMRIDSAGVVSMTTSLEIGAGVSIEISGWDSGETDIDGLVPGTAFGGLIEGRTNGHIVLGIRGNDALDGVHVLSGGGNYSSDTTYDTKVISFMANGEVVLGSHDSARGDALFDADSGPIVVTPIPYSTSQDATAIIFSATNFNNTTTNWGTEGLRLRLATTSGGVPRLIFDMANDGDLLHLTADGTGRVGIKEADPTCELHVDGAMRGGVYVGTEQSGTLTIASRNALVDMNGTVTIPASVFAEGDVIILYSSSASRTVNQGSGLVMHLDGTATTGNRTLAQRSMATIYFETATRCIISGGGVT